MNDLSLQAAVVVNSEQAETAFDRVGDKAQQMANEVSTSATKAGQAVDKIGDGAGASAEKFTRAESRISASIKRATNELELLGKTASQRLEFNIADKGLDAAKFEPALKKLRELEAQAQQAQRAASGSLDKMGISAAQTAAALRGVPAQFTDIVTSLQGGQAPLTVFLQQGGQLRDMFGGAGAAARALGGYVAGLINPFTLAAAGAAALAVAYNQGSAEADAYNMALITTGNAAGTTASQMQQMAGRISSVVGTQGAAAEALAQMAASGRVASQSLEYFSEVAIKFERTTGTAISETVKRFAELGASPVDASRKLNEETNYLTASIYEQIKALKDQGREADAAALAQTTYADALNNRSAQITQNLGAIEGAWKAIKDAAKSGWDAMLNVGRADSLETQIDNMRAKIAQAKGQDKNRPFSMPWDTSLADLEKQLSYLTEQERVIRRGAEAQAQRTQAEKEAIAAGDALQKTQDSGLTNQQKMNKALEEYSRHIEKLKATNPASALLSPDAIARGEKAIRDQFSDKGKGSAGIKSANKELADQAKLIAELNGLTGSFAKEWDTLSAVYKKGEMSLEQLTSAQAALLAKQPAIKAFADDQNKAQQTLDKANLDAAASRDKYLTSLSAGLDKIQADIAAQEEATARMGLSKEAIADLDAAKLEMLATDLELQAIKAMDRNLDQQTYDALKEQAQGYRDLAKARRAGAAKEVAVDESKKAADEWQRTSEQINQSLTDALMRGFESGKDFAKNMRDTIVNMFKTMVLRPVVSAIVSPISGALLGGMGLSTAAQAGQGVNGVSTALSGASLLGSVGGSLAAGAGWMTGATTLGGSLSAGMSLLGTGSLAGAGAGLGMLAGALGPIALGIGLLSSMFSRKLKDQGIEGTLGGDAGFDGNAYRFYKGGLFRSDKTERSELDPKLDSGLDAAVRQMQQSMLGLADSFGLPTEAITGFTQSIKLSFNGLDEAGIQAKIQDALTGYNEALAGAFIESMENSEVPAWVDRLIGNTDASAVQRLQDVAEWPARLLQSFGTSRDDLVRMFTEGLASGDAMAAGQSVADTLVASIQNAVFTNAAGQIFDIVNQGIVTPMLDAIATGASVADALSQATIDKTIERAKAQAQALAELYGNADFAAAMEQLRTAVGGALGQAGGYLQALPQTLVATQQIDTAAQDAARAAEEAQRAWQQITDGLLADQATLQIELLRAQGREEEALARERALAIEGMDAYQTALYDSNRALRSQIDTLRELGELLPSVIDQYLTPEQRTSNAYSSIASDLGAAGINVSAQTLMSASKEQIAQAAMAIYNLGTTSDETRLALLRAASGLADIKDQADGAAQAAADAAQAERERLLQVAQSATDAAYSALEREVNARRTVVQDTISDVRSVFAAVGDAARSLYGDVGSTSAMIGAQGLAFIDQALSNARLTGYLPDPEELRKAIAAATGDLGKSVFSSKFEEDRSRLMLAGKLSDLESISGDQLTEAEKQLASLDGILENARQQIDTLRGIDNRVLGVDTRIAMLTDAILAETAARAAVAAGAGGGGGGSTPPTQQSATDLLGAGGAYYSTLSDMGYARDTGLPWNGQDMRNIATELIQAGNARAVYDAVANSGFTLAQADAILKIPPGTAEEWARSVGLPVFHNGTPFVQQTGLALLERGEAVIPRTFNPFTQAGGAGNAEVVAELRAVREQLAATQAELAAIREHTKRTSTAVNGNPDQPAPTYITNKVKTVAA